MTICSPIWAFSLAGPGRSFCRQAAGKIRRVDYVLTHFTHGWYEAVAREMDGLLETTHEGLTSVVCRMGRLEEERI